MPTSEARKPTEAMEIVKGEVEVEDAALLLSLSGPGGENLTVLSKEFGVEAGTRGNVILLRGPRDLVAAAERALLEVLSVLGDGKLRGGEVQRSLRTLRQHPDLKLAEL